MKRQYVYGKIEFYKNDVKYANIDDLVEDILAWFKKQNLPIKIEVKNQKDEFGELVVVKMKANLQNLTKWFNTQYYWVKWNESDVKREWVDNINDNLYRWLVEL